MSPNPKTTKFRNLLEGNSSAAIAEAILKNLSTRKMTADAAAQASATTVTAHATLALAEEQRTANIIALAEHIRSDSALKAIIDVSLDRMSILELTAEGPSASDDLDEVEIPSAEDLKEAIWVMAADLWEADPGKQTPARTFGEDYSHSQDRYLAMATAILAPEPVEPGAKQ